MYKKISISLILANLLLIPLSVFATAPGTPTPVNLFGIPLSPIVDTILNALWIVFIVFAVIMFIAAGFKFLTTGGDSSKAAEARMMIIWGIVGVAVAIVAFSIPRIELNFINP